MSEATLFAATLAVLRSAFELRKPDAWDNAIRLYEKYAIENQSLSKMALTSDDIHARAKLAGERACALEELIYEYRNANLLQERGRFGPTPEALVRPGRADAMLALRQRGHIDAGQESAANEIAELIEVVTASLHARGGTDLRSTGGAKLGDFIPVKLSEWYSARYLPWVGAMKEGIDPITMLKGPDGGGQHLELVLTVVRDGISLDTSRRQFHIGWAKALRLLKNGLSLYDVIRDEHEMRDFVRTEWRDVALGKGRTA